MKVFNFVAISLLSTQSALACPVSGDLATGIRFGVDDGDFETFRQMRPGVIESTFVAADGTVYRNLLGQGIYLLEWTDIVEGKPDMDSRSVYAFAMTPETLPLPEPGGFANLGVLVNAGGTLEQEMQMYSFGEASEITFGECRYAMIPIEVRYAPDNGQGLTVLNYLPDLGLAYFTESTANGQTDTYTYHSIEVVK